MSSTEQGSTEQGHAPDGRAAGRRAALGGLRAGRWVHGARRAAWLLPVAIGAVVMLLPSLVGGADPVPYDLQHQFLPWSTAPDAPVPQNGLLRDLVDTYDPEQRTIWERLVGPGDAGWLEGAGLGAPGWWFVGSGALSPFVALDHGSGLPNGAGVAGVVRLLVAAAGAGMFDRRLGGSRWAAAVAAGAFAFSGFMLSWFGWPQAHVGAWVGWVWWAAHRAGAEDAPPLAVPGLALVTALAWLGGFPAVTALLGLSAAGVVLAAAWPAADGWRGRLRGITRGASGLLAGTLLAGVTLIPSLAHLQAVDLSARAEAWRGAIPLSLLPRVLLPDAFGDGEAVAYWGRLNLIEGAAYVGVPVLVLAAAALVLGWRRRGVRIAAGLTAAGAALAYGFPPLLQVMRVVPGLSTNPPARGVVLACAAAAVLGGLGLDAVRERLRASRSGWAALATVLAAVGAVVLIAQPQAEVADLAARRLTTPAAAAAARDLLVGEVAAAAALAAATILLCAAVWRARGETGVVRTSALVLLVLLAVVDPWAEGRGWNAQVPRAQAYPDSAALTALAADLPVRGRVAAPDGVLLPMTDLRGPVDDARGRRFLTADQRARVEAAGGRFASATRWVLDPDPATWTAALGALGVAAVVVPEDVDGPAGWDRVELGEGIAAVRVPTVSPPVSLAEEVQVVPEDAVAGTVAERSAAGTVVVAEEAVAAEDLDPSAMEGRPTGGAASLVEVTGRRHRVAVDAPDGGVLRLTEPWLPGWSAEVVDDGGTVAAVPVLPVDGGMVGVVLPPGSEEVTLRWRAPGLVAGWWATALTALALAAATGRALHGARFEAYRRGMPLDT